jgi:hypothetical protein
VYGRRSGDRGAREQEKRGDSIRDLRQSVDDLLNHCWEWLLVEIETGMGKVQGYVATAAIARIAQ